MSSHVLLIIVTGVGALSWVLTDAVRRFAIARSFLDVPNHRSSHSVPTPRGGGLAIAGSVLPTLGLLGLTEVLPANAALALGGGGLLLAAVGWRDDRGDVPARWRAAVHFLAAAWVLGWLGGLPSITAGTSTVPLGAFGATLAAVGIVWMTNLFNFMDGVDGIAGTEAVMVGLAGGCLLWLDGAPGLASVSFLIAGASAGFLAWNWAPAKIFMGDVGSGLLGFLFAGLAVLSQRNSAVPLLVWLLMLGVFIFDATATLLRRLARGERWYAAHRSHAYQRAVQAGWSHAAVCRGVAALNLALIGAAVLIYFHPHLTIPTLAASICLLTSTYVWIEKDRPMTHEGGRRVAGCTCSDEGV